MAKIGISFIHFQRSVLVLGVMIACTNSHAQSSAGGTPEVGGDIGTTLDSQAFKDEVQRQKEQNSGVVKSINQESIANAQRALPQFNQFGGELKYGTHKTVSSDGEKIVSMIRSLTTDSLKEHATALRRLQELSDRGIPEAQNFVGFAAEYGLYGARVDVNRAIQFYGAAASSGYQPAIYNLALAAAYGKNGHADLGRAAGLLDKAATKGPESSLRVCGFASFLNYRRGDQQAALDFSKGCPSPLTALPLALTNNAGTAEQRIESLRKSIATGVDDGFELLESVTRPTASSDIQFNYCKYYLINRYRTAVKVDRLHEDALRCYEQYAPHVADHNVEVSRREQIVPGIISFVPTEITVLQAMRKSNRFHFKWSVPYLPFPQQDVDLFEPLITGVKS
jgi:TPR repeat protein